MTPDSPDVDGAPRVRCWACAEFVHPDARKCRWCGEWYGELAQRDLMSGPLVNAGNVQETIAALPHSIAIERAVGEGVITDDAASSTDLITASMIRPDAICLEVGRDVACLVEPEADGELLERLKHVRRRIAMEFGVIAPGVRVRPHANLGPGQYQIRIKGDLVAEGEVLVTHQLGIGQDLDVPGIDAEHTTDPIYGTPAVWIPAGESHRGEEHGLQMFTPTQVVSVHAATALKQHLAELLTREEVAELLNMARQDAPMVVQELVPNMLALGQLRQVLQNLVREQVPIKDLSTILNALADNAVYTKDPHALTEHVRATLGRKICARHQSPDGTLKAFMLSPDAERAIQNAIQLNETGQVLMLDPDTSQAIQNNLADALDRYRGQILDPVLITPPKIRRHVRRLVEINFPTLVVMSYAEIVAGTEIDTLETIEAHRSGSGGHPPSALQAPVTPVSAPVSDWLMTDSDEPAQPEGDMEPPGKPTDTGDWSW